MYVVAITRRSPGSSDDVAVLTPIVGTNAYDMRLRLAAPLPLIVGHAPDAAAAGRWLEAVRRLGHGGVACELDRVPRGSTVRSVRDFELHPDRIEAACFDGGATQLAFEDILVLVHAMLATDTETAQVASSKKLSAGRILATGGLIRHKTTTTQTRSQSVDHEPALYLIRKSGEEPLVVQQDRAHYAGLGARIPPTRMACFQELLQRLRVAAPGALFDNRLLSQKRKASSFELQRTRSEEGKARSETSAVIQSNAEATELAVHLIAVAHLQGQL